MGKIGRDVRGIVRFSPKLIALKEEVTAEGRINGAGSFRIKFTTGSLRGRGEKRGEDLRMNIWCDLRVAKGKPGGGEWKEGLTDLSMGALEGGNSVEVQSKSKTSSK